MKRWLLFGICLLAAHATRAQDLIVRRDSVRQEGRVFEIRPDEVRYKRVSNPDGPVYVVPVAQIAYIRYANGEVERFARPELPSDAPERGGASAGSIGQPAGTAPQPDRPGPGVQEPQDAERTYAVGD